MKEILIRSITGAGLVIAIVGSILLGKFYFASLFLLITVLGTIEFYKMFSASKNNPQKIFGTIISGILYILLALVAYKILSPLYIALIVVLLFVIPIRELYRKSESPIQNISITIFGILYIGLTLGLLNFLFYGEAIEGDNFHFVLAFFVILWTSDSMAYLTGMSIGKHRLFERISPKKSWEGFFGGIISAMIVGYIFSLYFTDFNTLKWVVYSMVVAISGVYGDLVQSLFKRSLGLKDSGKIFPGHGGILDRFDAVLLAIPIAFAYVMLFF